MNETEKALLKTIVYYDCLDYPLTPEELEVFSPPNGGFSIFKLEGFIEKAEGFYFLKGRKNLIRERREKNEIARNKWKKALKAVSWLRIIPYIRLVFGSGSLALSNTGEESDLDVLIVAKHGRIWTSRLLIVLLLSLLGVRRTRYDKIASDKVCLNHFITDRSLYIPRKSIYTAQLYARLVPILAGNKKLLDDFCEANKWVGEWVRGWPETIKLKNQNSKVKTIIQKSKVLSFFKKFGEKVLDTKLGDWLEKILRKYQLRRINSFHLTHKPGGRVKADDESLEFHPDSPELKIINKYNKTMRELGFPELGKEQDSGLLT